MAGVPSNCGPSGHRQVAAARLCPTSRAYCAGLATVRFPKGAHALRCGCWTQPPARTTPVWLAPQGREHESSHHRIEDSIMSTISYAGYGVWNSTNDVTSKVTQQYANKQREF